MRDINRYIADMLRNGTYTDYGFDYKPTFDELKADVLMDKDFLESLLYKNKYLNKKEV